jgi:hypothetical protein
MSITTAAGTDGGSTKLNLHQMADKDGRFRRQDVSDCFHEVDPILKSFTLPVVKLS